MMIGNRRRQQMFRGHIATYGPVWAMLVAMTVLSGCMAREMAENFAHTIRGDYYLSASDPGSGVEYFRQEVAAAPENGLNNYYYGRLLLRSQNARAALPYLKKAADLDPENADYQFWTGVAYGLLKKVKEERAQYNQALKLDPDHQQALTSLGHSYMRSGQYAKALKIYDKALSLWPENPAALYNKGLALSKLGRKKEERSAWHRYLQVNGSGGLARNAVDHLNGLGDFSYRNYFLGGRVVTVKAVRFVNSGAEVTKASVVALEMIGEAAAELQPGILQVVVYQQGNVDLAKARALNIRRLLLAEVPGLEAERIGVSWFGEPQRNRKKKWAIKESVDFFLTNK